MALAGIASLVGAGTSLLGGLLGSSAAKKNAKLQEIIAKQSLGRRTDILHGNEVSTRALLDDQAVRAGLFANLGQDQRARSMAQLLGLIGGSRFAGQQFRTTVPNFSAIAGRGLLENLAKWDAEIERLTQDEARFPDGTGARTRRIAELRSQREQMVRQGGSLSQDGTTRELSFDIAAPVGGGLFDVARAQTADLFAGARANTDRIHQDVQAAHDRFFGELNRFDTEGFTRRELGLLRDLARPEEQRLGNELRDRLFAQGRIGTTGGTEEQGLFSRNLGEADLRRVLQSIAGGRAEQNRLFDLSFNPDYRNLLGIRQGLEDEQRNRILGLEDEQRAALSGLFGQFFGAENDATAQFGQGQLATLQNRLAAGQAQAQARLDSENTFSNQLTAAKQQQAQASQGLFTGLGQFGSALAGAALPAVFRTQAPVNPSTFFPRPFFGGF